MRFAATLKSAALNTHSVDIWTIPLDTPRPVILSVDEQARAARFRFEADRMHWTRARSALRAILAGYLHMRPEQIQFSYGEQGKPAVREIEFNLSHARNWAILAVSELVPVGIDIEAIRDNVEIEKLLARIGETGLTGSSTEELFRRWARREARTKALGSALMELPPPRVCAVDIDAPPGFVAAVALADRMPLARYHGGPE